MSKTIIKGSLQIAWAFIWHFRVFIMICALLFSLGVYTGYKVAAPKEEELTVLRYNNTLLEARLQLEGSVAEVYSQKYRATLRDYNELKRAFTTIDIQHHDVVEYELTAYCACPICCDEWADGITYLGTEATASRTIAVDPDEIPLGSIVYIENLGTFIAEDIGGAIKGNRIDVYFEDHEEALRFGRQTRNVIVLEMGGL